MSSLYKVTQENIIKMNSVENNISTDKKKLKIYTVASAAIAVILAFIGVLASVPSSEARSRYFENHALATCLYAALALMVAFALSAFFAFKRTTLVTDNVESSALRFLNLSPAIALIICSIVSATSNTALGLRVGVTTICVLSAIGCVSKAFKLPDTVKIICGYAQVLFLIFIIVSLYLERSIEINCPFKLLVQFAAAALMLEALTDMRGILYRCRARMFVSSKTLSLSMCLLTGCVIVYTFASGNKVFDKSYLAYSIYFLCNSLCTYLSLKSASAE